MKYPTARSLRKWGKKWWWVFPLWTALAVLSFLFTTFGFPSFGSAVASSNFANTGDWSMYLGGLGHSGYDNTETAITAQTAPNLKLHWSYKAGGSISAQPVVVNGTIYWGSWDGYENATDLNGNLLWQTFLGTNAGNAACHPPKAGVASTPSFATVKINGIMTPVIFVGGGNANFYALNATTGAIIWQTSLGTPPATFLWGEKTVSFSLTFMDIF